MPQDRKIRLPENLRKDLQITDQNATTEPIGRLGDYVGETFRLRGVDGSGKVVEWVVKPTGARSFEMTVPEGHELGMPAAWENISIMTQRVVCRSGSCGCDGNQCGCQGQNCGSNCNSNRGFLRLLVDDPAALINEKTLEVLRAKFQR
jgi:hypothetical protein